jgi:predicted ATPase/transcriptional regulator with XRE-family HTH domain
MANARDSHAELSGDDMRPLWYAVLRALREARGVTQEGWAAQLSVGRSTVRRWERGDAAPGADVEQALVAYCRDHGLFRAFATGPLAGLTLTPELLRDLLAEGRLAASPDAAPHGPRLLPLDLAAYRPVPADLPAPLTDFIGRSREVAELTRLLDSARLVTLTGVGGVGKTRLALEVAASMRAAFPDGVVFVPLAPITDPALVATAIAQTVGVREVEGRTLRERLTDYLREKALLLVLDNFEQVVTAAPLVADLLTACPRLRTLVTSREVLRLSGERVFNVPPLEVPDPARPPAPDELLSYEAVRLFVDRARSARPDFRLTAEDAPAVAAICARLDVLPLAIVLAAARARVLPPRALAARLTGRLDLLGDGARDLPARHQTLHATLAWSYDLLSAPEQVLFRRLSVFVGGFTLAAAEAVCARPDSIGLDVLDGVTALVDKSLVRQEDEPDPAGEPRFGMLETVRAYALERLTAHEETAATQQRHAAYYMALAEAAEEPVRGPAQQTWLRRLERERHNLRTAHDWESARGETETALRLASALFEPWRMLGHWSEGQRWLAAVLTAGDAVAPAVRAKALAALGDFACLQGDYNEAIAAFEESLAQYRALDDQRGIAHSLCSLGAVTMQVQGDAARGVPMLEESLRGFRALNVRRGIAWSLGELGQVAQQQGDAERAIALYDESLAVAREMGDTRGIATTLGYLGALAHSRGEYDRAAACYEESVARFREAGDRDGAVTALLRLAVLRTTGGEHQAARALTAEGLALGRELGDAWAVASGLLVRGAIAVGQGRPEHAVRFFGVGERLLEAIGAPVPAAYRDGYAHLVSAMRHALGEEGYAAAFAAGQALPTDQAVVEAMDATAP